MPGLHKLDLYCHNPIGFQIAQCRSFLQTSKRRHCLYGWSPRVNRQVPGSHGLDFVTVHWHSSGLYARAIGKEHGIRMPSCIQGVKATVLGSLWWSC